MCESLWDRLPINCWLLLLARGAGVITSLVKADGVTILPCGIQGVEMGERVKVHLYRPLSDLEQTIFVIGSHDMTLDLVAQFLSKTGRVWCLPMLAAWAAWLR